MLLAAARDPSSRAAFDRLARLATRLLGVPTALVSLVAHDRQVFVGCVGLPGPAGEARETPLSQSFCQHVVADRRAFVVADARTDPRVAPGAPGHAALPDLGVVAYAGVPLITEGGQVLGALCAIDGSPRVWSDDDLAVLGDLAGATMAEVELRAASELARALAHEQTESASWQRFMLTLSDVLRPLTDPAGIEAAATRLLGEQLATARAYYAAVDAEAGVIRIAHDHVRPGVASIAGTLPLAAFDWIGDAFHAGEAVAVSDVAHAPLVPVAQREPLAALGVAAFIAVPLRRDGRLVAVLSVTETTPRAWTPLETVLVREVAERTWAALDAAGAQEAATRAGGRTDLLLRLTQALATTRTLEAVADVVVALMTDALGAQTGALAVPTADGGALRLVRTVGFPEAVEATVRHQPLPLASPLTDCFRTRRPVWLERRDGPDGLDVRYPPITPVWDALGANAAVFIPLLLGDEPVGTISFAFPSPRRFSADERAFVIALGRQVAVAVDRARLFGAADAARREAEIANRSKAEFLASMSHELRTPLNAIGGYAELLELGVRGPVTPEQLADLERIQRAQRHLLGLVNGVLDYAKVDAGAVRYEIEEVALDEVLRVCEALVAPQVRAKGLACAFVAPPPTLRVRADREKVQQVVLNLLSNAVKFTEAGGRVTLAAAGGDTADAPVRMTVTDTGIGIPADKLEAVFAPFVQVDSAYTRARGGTGLGLAISRELARGMGGDLTAESRAGEGSTFTFLLPAVPPPE
ncbi:GAF domain-containing protein [Roseisolibacter sp. H3M3-2]|uniref:GAF domain-containing protein n=1 Tax=Roseisolibacter sp. H3M3-2 TaxID=3031323 RepID=UPI0023DC0CB9|nr:GAF domain-containing protein [Roseisolibacter sp. H3M3-2]MDF1502742.1 GAF domain-containing protein [Roseisolibacter sp. H3M3-2]